MEDKPRHQRDTKVLDLTFPDASRAWRAYVHERLEMNQAYDNPTSFLQVAQILAGRGLFSEGEVFVPLPS